MARTPSSDAKSQPQGAGVPRIDWPVRLRVVVARLPRSAPHPFEIVPSTDELGALARLLGVSRLRKLRFAGRLVPMDAGGWRLEADLGATVVQPCVASLTPVTTRLDERVGRTYTGATQPAEPGEAEMPEDVDVEPLPTEIDLAAVMIEALALALPQYPRAADAAPVGAADAADMPARRPFAVLAGLRDQLREARQPGQPAGPDRAGAGRDGNGATDAAGPGASPRPPRPDEPDA